MIYHVVYHEWRQNLIRFKLQIVDRKIAAELHFAISGPITLIVNLWTDEKEDYVNILINDQEGFFKAAQTF